MNRIKQSFLLIIFAFTLFSCESKKNDIKAAHSIALLNEAEYMLDIREFGESESKVIEALEMLAPIISKNPTNIDYLLLRSRAYYLLFSSKNTLVIENSPEQPQSLVRIPEMWNYIDYDTTILLAKKDIEEILKQGKSATLEQKVAARAMLGNIFRLNPSTCLKAYEQYQKAVDASKKLLHDLEHPKNKLEQKNLAVARVKEQTQALRTSQVEVLLLAREWKKSLSILESMMAGEDLKYFSVQFTLLENKIAALQTRLKESTRYNKESREGKLNRLLEKVRKKKRKDVQGFEKYNPIEIELIKTERSLVSMKNNLIYRIICYHHTKQNARLQRAHNILRSFYPNLDEKITEALK